jgi:hypothetical protein
VVNSTDDTSEPMAAGDGDSNSNTANGAIWVRAEDMGKINFSLLKTGGIHDIFLLETAFSDAKYKNNLTAFLNNAKLANIRVSAWVICFSENGKWVEPSGQYTYQVKTAYKVAVKTPYRHYYKARVRVAYKKLVRTSIRTPYKSYYRYKGKLLFRWKYRTSYRWVRKTFYRYVYQTRYVIKYKTTYKTEYKTETKTGYNSNYITSYINNLTSKISNYIKIDGVNGIHLDYLRYPGTAYKYNYGTSAITNFVSRVSSTVRAIKPNALLSAALMPETSANAKYYGQDYPSLGKYLDVLVPMIYSGNYNKDATWIGSVTKYIAQHSGNAQVWAGITTYKSDANPTPLSVTALLNDTQAALNNGASGFALFRYGNVLNNDFFNYSGNLQFKPVDPINNPVTTTISLANIKAAATNVKNFIEINHRLPSYVTISGIRVSMSEFIYLMSNAIININSNKSSGVAFKELSADPSATSNSLSGKLYLSGYVSLSNSLLNYINANGKAPATMSTALGTIQFRSMVYHMAKIIDFHSVHARLPSYVTLSDTVFTSTSSSSTNAYLQATKNCQVNDSTIKSLANQLTSGLTSTLAKATAIFNWVRNNTSYSFYYNTKYGAVNTLKYKTGNCVDLSHLVVALSRAAGIQARYGHGTATFTSGNVYGHVWAELYINGSWVKADASSNGNSLGKITNWNTNTVKMKGIYTELPF